jgi:hypothetical protein
VTAFFEPNKDELALNLCLIESPAAKARVVGRRLFPAKLPRPFSYAVARAVYHLRALIPGIGVVMKNSKVGFSLRRASARLFRITARPHHRD